MLFPLLKVSTPEEPEEFPIRFQDVPERLAGGNAMVRLAPSEIERAPKDSENP